MKKSEIPTTEELTTMIFNIGNKGNWASGYLKSYVKDNYDELKQAIFKVKKDGTFSKEKCRNRSMKYSRDERYKEYVELFESILEGR